MHTHEYQAKTLLRNYAIPTPEYAVAATAEELKKAVDRLGWNTAAIKIQVHAGGRGKGGGVQLAHSRDEIVEYGRQLIGMRLTNHQTGPQGVVAKQILVTPLVEYVKEAYLAVVLDRQRGAITLLASSVGGVDIEEVAKTRPDELLVLPLPIDGSLRSYHRLRLCKMMDWHGATASEGCELAANLIRAFIESDALLLEINPLVQLADGHLLALDAKWTIDDDALFRHPDYRGLFDIDQLPAAEAVAHRQGLSYIALDGNIGCMVNGAGLAMATMDIIQHYGGMPANFLDVGGGASLAKITAGFELLQSDPGVKAILVNIFGGIMNCATIAQGLVQAATERPFSCPVVVRMEGTNVEEARVILTQANLGLILVTDLSDAAARVVAAAELN
jgi:succinyl-CoA synthetase beta subunit